MAAQIIFSGRVNANDGFNNPAPVRGPSGWIVDKHQQTEISEITHNLSLTDPEQQFHVTVTAMKSDVVANVESVSANSFTISTWIGQTAPVGSDFMFVAVYYGKKPHS